MLDPPSFSIQPHETGAVIDARVEQLRAASKALEGQFLAEMLSQSGLGQAREALGGGPEEAAFASVLPEIYGNALVERGGIGLAEEIFAALVAREAAS